MDSVGADSVLPFSNGGDEYTSEMYVLLNDTTRYQTGYTFTKDYADVIVYASIGGGKTLNYDGASTNITHFFSTFGYTNNASGSSFLSLIKDVKAGESIVTTDYYNLIILANESNQDDSIDIVPLVPLLSSNTGSDGGEAFASSVYNPYETWYAFDGENASENNCWLMYGNPVNNYLGYKFTKPTCVKKIKITNRNSTNPVPIKIFKLQGSDNGDTWIDIGDSFVNNNGQNATTTFTVDNDEYYIQYRIYITEVYSANSPYAAIGVLQFDGYQMKSLVPVMTSNKLPYGEAFCSSSHATNSYPAWKAFDGGVEEGSMWHSADGVVKCHLGYRFIEPVCVKKFRITNRASNTHAPKIIKLKGSNDGVNWIDISGELTNTQGAGVTTWFDVGYNYSKYSYYIIDIQSSYTGSVVISELQFYAEQKTSSIDSVFVNTVYQQKISSSSGQYETAQFRIPLSDYKYAYIKGYWNSLDTDQAKAVMIETSRLVGQRIQIGIDMADHDRINTSIDGVTIISWGVGISFTDTSCIAYTYSGGTWHDIYISIWLSNYKLPF